jgi:hypothetical protein
MDRRVLLVGITLVLLIAGCSCIGAADSSANNKTTPTTETLDGTSIEIDAEFEASLLDNFDEIAPGDQYSAPDHAFRFMVDGETYFVYTDTDPVTGSATVRGTVIIEPRGDGAGVIVADSVRFETEGEPVDLDRLRENPGEYHNQHVRVTGTLRQLSFTTDVESQLVTQSSTGLIGGELYTSEQITAYPGQQARWTVLNMSGSEFGESQREEMLAEVTGPINGVLTISTNTQFWIDGEVTMDAVVMSTDAGAGLHVADVTPIADEIDGPDEIQQRGDELSDEVVRFETQVVGSTTSTQEFLTTVAPCGTGDNVLVPTGPTCVPVVTDSTIHSGVLFTGNPESMDDVVPYAGLSNHHQNMVTQPETGTYEVTGRVVAGSEIDPSLEGQFAVVVYDMDRQGDLTARGSARNNAEAHASLVTDRMKEQANSSQREWQQRQLEETGESSVSITNAEYEDSRVPPDGTGAVIVTVENTGSQSGSITIEWAGPNSWTLAERTVTVAAGETRQVRLEHQFDRGGEGGLRTWVNSEDIGMMAFRDPSNSETSNTETSNPETSTETADSNILLTALWDSDASSPVTIGIFTIGLVTVLGAAVLDVMLRFKRRSHPRDFSKRQEQIENVFAIGLIPLAAGGFLSGGVFWIIASVSIVFGLLWSIYEVISSLYHTL